jgi:hypothetical protein
VVEFWSFGVFGFWSFGNGFMDYWIGGLMGGDKGCDKGCDKGDDEGDDEGDAGGEGVGAGLYRLLRLLGGLGRVFTLD